MKASFKNGKINSRLSHIKSSAPLPLFIVLYFSLPLLFPSYAAYLDSMKDKVLPAVFWATIELMIGGVLILYIFFARRIVTKIEIDSGKNYVSVTVVPPFTWTEKKIECKLSQTQIQTDYLKQKRYWLSTIVTEYYTVYLIHPNFGTVDVPVADGPERKEVYNDFQKLKEDVAASIRRRM